MMDTVLKHFFLDIFHHKIEKWYAHISRILERDLMTQFYEGKKMSG